MKYHLKDSSGFTLVELSIVLVIVGLLISGILVGQSLIETVKVNNTIKQISEYQILMGLFESRYKYPPGDIPNAQDYWGAGTGTTGTCNGDGDKLIGSNQTLGTGGCSGSNNQREYYYVAEHLYLGGYLKTPYYGGNNNDAFLKLDFDKTVTVQAGASDRVITGRATENAFNIYSTDFSQGAALTTKQAYQLDNKVDDGLPSVGSVTGRDATIALGAPSSTTRGACTSTATWGGYVSASSSRKYDFDTDGKACSLHFYYKNYK